jgi:hypothetical protein
MKYITGTYALNLPCELDTSGDWHYSAIDWSNIPMRDSNASVYRNADIAERMLPTGKKKYVANHIRALLDLIEQGYFSSAQGMRENFIANEKYTQTVFDMVWKLRSNSNWTQIDGFMGKEYLCDWLRYRDRREHERAS